MILTLLDASVLMVIALRVAVPVVVLMALSIFFLRAAWAERAPSQLPRGISYEEVQSSTSLKDLSENPVTMTVWALSIVLSMMYLMAGIPKLGGFEQMVNAWEQYGYSTTMRQIVGGVEFLGAILLLIPRVAFYAATALGLVMIGSIITHVSHGEFSRLLIPMGCFAALTVIAVHRRPEWFSAS
ncbi:MAG: DoxX family protein [Myxococcota bacterium]